MNILHYKTILRYLMALFEKELNKIFVSPDGKPEQLTLKSLLNFMERYPKHMWKEPFLNRLFEFLMQKLNSGKCSDPGLVAAIINLQFVYSFRSLRVLRKYVNFIRARPCPSLNVRHGVNYYNLCVGRILREGNWPLMRMLIQYGVIRPTSSGSQIDGLDYTCRRNFIDFMNSAIIPEQRARSEAQIKEISQRLNLSRFRQLNAEEKVTVLRRQTVANVLGMLNNDSDPEKEAVAIKCLKYYFQATAEPFVAVKELQELISVPQPLSQMLDKQHVEAKLEKYCSLFPQSKVLEPRSLLHLSRCAARTYLCKFGVLPHVINKLPLPDDFKDYLSIVKQNDALN